MVILVLPILFDKGARQDPPAQNPHLQLAAWQRAQESQQMNAKIKGSGAGHQKGV